MASSKIPLVQELKDGAAQKSGIAASVKLFVNNQFKAEILASVDRLDLKNRNICKEGGGFDIDISSFSGFGKNNFRITDPDGSTLHNGEFSLSYQDIILGEAIVTIGSLKGVKVGLFGNARFARDTTIGTCMSKILACLGVETIDEPKNTDHTKINIWHCFPHKEKPQGYQNTVNFNLMDISKSGIDEAHRSVFGRAVCVTEQEIVDDVQYVIKSEENAAHDGKIVFGRDVLKMDTSGSVVQRLIDNRLNESHVLDLRVPVIGGTIPHVILKRRPISNRFSNSNISATLTRTENIFSEEEKDSIIKFCRYVKAEYCELDILRDATEGKIWVVDVNNTPAGPPNGMTQSEQNLATREQAIAFYNEFLRN